MSGEILIKNCAWADLPILTDPRGKLGFAQVGDHVGFEIRRVYYLFDNPAGADRGAHAHKALQQVLVLLAGSFTLHLDDGRTTQDVAMDTPGTGLRIGPGVWRELRQMAQGSVVLVIASEPYSEADYFRDYAEFKASVRH